LKLLDDDGEKVRAGRPRAGAWIETLLFRMELHYGMSPPRGGVD